MPSDPEADTRGVEPLSDEEWRELTDAIHRDHQFTHNPLAAELLTGGPAITAHLLYTIRDLGPRLIATLDAEVAKRQEAERQRDHLIAVLDESHALIQRLRAALERLMKELGIPTPAYPAPVANAWRIAAAALDRGRTLPGGAET